jgi:hypothetical protein
LNESIELQPKTIKANRPYLKRKPDDVIQLNRLQHDLTPINNILQRNYGKISTVTGIYDTNNNNSNSEFYNNHNKRLSKQECMQRYGSRSYLNESNKRLPPMFYTFPGSGNTWGRLLIEYATGFLLLLLLLLFTYAV